MKNRTYLQHPLESASVVAQAIQDELAGRPMKRLLVADALGMKPASTNFTSILRSSRAYGLTEGTEKADVVSLTPLGQAVTAGTPSMAAQKEAVLTPPPFGAFFRAYDNAKLPSDEMLKKLLVSDFAVPAERAEECAVLIRTNGEYAGLISSISGSLHVILNGPESEAHVPADVSDSEDVLSDVGETEADLHELQTAPATTPLPSTSATPEADFRGPREEQGTAHEGRESAGPVQDPAPRRGGGAHARSPDSDQGEANDGGVRIRNSDLHQRREALRRGGKRGLAPKRERRA